MAFHAKASSKRPLLILDITRIPKQNRRHARHLPRETKPIEGKTP
jgi:hypothetical protein